MSIRVPMTGGRKRPYAPEMDAYGGARAVPGRNHTADVAPAAGCSPTRPFPNHGAPPLDPGRPSGVSSISPSYRWEVPPDGLISAPPAIEERGLGRSPPRGGAAYRQVSGRGGEGKGIAQSTQCPTASLRRSRNQ
ncbi:hypothetical protein GCM10009548_34060 [Streptomyces malaysiensis subsp. malaysiensis]